MANNIRYLSLGWFVCATDVYMSLHSTSTSARFFLPNLAVKRDNRFLSGLFMYTCPRSMGDIGFRKVK